MFRTLVPCSPPPPPPLHPPQLQANSLIVSAAFSQEEGVEVGSGWSCYTLAHVVMGRLVALSRFRAGFS